MKIIKIDFNVGDFVIVHKPTDERQHQLWDSLMDKYDGKEMRVSGLYFSTIGDDIIARLDGCVWNFNIEWLEKVHDESIDFDTDIKELF